MVGLKCPTEDGAVSYPKNVKRETSKTTKLWSGKITNTYLRQISPPETLKDKQIWFIDSKNIIKSIQLYQIKCKKNSYL